MSRRPGSPGRLPAAEGDARRGVGQHAEELAARLLEARGMTVVARNWRRPEGELDLVALDGGVCVFVEVRSRTGDEQGHPLEHVTPRKRAQVIRTARLFLDEERVSAPDGFRFDVVGVLFPTNGGEPECSYVADAFRVGD